jgi:hypothetical protein
MHIGFNLVLWLICWRSESMSNRCLIRTRIDHCCSSMKNTQQVSLFQKKLICEFLCNTSTQLAARQASLEKDFALNIPKSEFFLGHAV